MTDDPFDLLVEAIHIWEALIARQQESPKAFAQDMNEDIELAERRARELAKECC